jgi:hypothetical protein
MFGKSGVSGREKNEFAFYFTDLKEVAEEYGKNLADDEEYVVKQYFLNIRNLFEAFSRKNQYQITFKELYDLANKSGEPIYELTPSGERALYIKGDGKGNYQTLPREWWEYDSFRRKYLYETTPNEVYAYFVDWDKKSSNQFFWRAYLQRYLNYDGVVFYERTHNDLLNPDRDEGDYYSIEKPWVLPEFGDEFSKTYGVFNSNQIKLADGTNKTFDSKNPDIRFEKGGDITKYNRGGLTNAEINDKIMEVEKRFWGDIRFSGYHDTDGVLVRLKDHPARWSNFIEYNTEKKSGSNTDYKFLSIIISDDVKLYDVEENVQKFYDEYLDDFPNAEAKEIVLPSDTSVDEIIEEIEYEVKRMNKPKKFEKGGILHKKDNVGWTIFGTIALIVTLGKVNALKK